MKAGHDYHPYRNKKGYMKEYYEKPHAKKLNKLDERDTFLEGNH